MNYSETKLDTSDTNLPLTGLSSKGIFGSHSRKVWGLLWLWAQIDLGDLSTLACRPCLPGVGLSAKWPQPHGGQHFFLVISAEAPGLTLLVPDWPVTSHCDGLC